MLKKILKKELKSFKFHHVVLMKLYLVYGDMRGKKEIDFKGQICFQFKN